MLHHLMLVDLFRLLFWLLLLLGLPFPALSEFREGRARLREVAKHEVLSDALVRVPQHLHNFDACIVNSLVLQRWMDLLDCPTAKPHELLPLLPLAQNHLQRGLADVILV